MSRSYCKTCNDTFENNEIAQAHECEGVPEIQPITDDVIVVGNSVDSSVNAVCGDCGTKFGTLAEGSIHKCGGEIDDDVGSPRTLTIRRMSVMMEDMLKKLERLEREASPALYQPARIAEEVPFENDKPSSNRTLQELKDDPMYSRSEWSAEFTDEWNRAVEKLVCIYCKVPDVGINASRAEQLMICEGCCDTAHYPCVGMKRIPKEDWYCMACTFGGITIKNKKAQSKSFKILVGMNALFYLRVSSKGQNQPEFGRVGVFTQNTSVLTFASTNQFMVRGTFDDVGTGLEMGKRKQFQLCLEKAIQLGNCIILIYDVSRMGRNYEEALTNLDRLHEAGCFVYSVSEKLSSIDADTKEINPAFLKLALEAQRSSEQLAERIRASIKRRKDAGGHIGPAPFGYETFRDPLDNIIRLRKKESEYPIVSKILALVDDILKTPPQSNSSTTSTNKKRKTPFSFEGTCLDMLFQRCKTDIHIRNRNGKFFTHSQLSTIMRKEGVEFVAPEIPATEPTLINNDDDIIIVNNNKRQKTEESTDPQSWGDRVASPESSPELPKKTTTPSIPRESRNRRYKRRQTLFYHNEKK